MKPTAIEPLLTTRQVADLLALRDISTVTRLIRSKALHAVYIGTRWLVAPAALRDFIAKAPTMENTTSRRQRIRLAHA